MGLVFLNLVVFWHFGWLPEVQAFEWPPVGLCLGMEGTVLLGFPQRFDRFFTTPIERVGWSLIFLGFLFQLLGTQYGRFA